VSVLDLDIQSALARALVPSRVVRAESLRLGIDGEALRVPLSGIGRYVLNLCQELERLFPIAKLFAYSRLPPSRLALPSARWLLRHEVNPAYRRLPSFVWLKTRGARLCRRDNLDLFWAGRTLHPQLDATVRTICTVHDLNHLIVPETMQVATLWSHRMWFERDVALAYGVVANSHGTAARVRQHLKREVAGIVAPGLSKSLLAHRESVSLDVIHDLEAIGAVGPYILSVATLEPRKNIGGLVRAFVALKLAGKLQDFRLVLSGTLGWQKGETRRLLEAAAAHGVVTTGYVPDSLLSALYARAELFVLPSLYEGFGMPVLEARACGTKVLVSDVPELRESAGPEGTVVQPTVAGLAEGIERALLAPRNEKGGELVERFSWSRGAERLAAIFTEAMRNTTPSHRRVA
jgi:glycosyltransferase involved in cell wall biosynthesis